MFKVKNSGVFIVNSEYISHLFLVFLLLTLNRWKPSGCGEIVQLWEKKYVTRKISYIKNYNHD